MLKRSCNTNNDLIQIKYWYWQISLTLNLNMEIIYCHKTTHSILQLQIRYCLEIIDHQQITTRVLHWKYPLVISILSKETECSIATAKKRNDIQDGWMLLWLRNNLLWPQLSLQGMPHLNNWTICFLINTKIESHLSNTSALNLNTQSAQYEPH